MYTQRYESTKVLSYITLFILSPDDSLMYTDVHESCTCTSTTRYSRATVHKIIRKYLQRYGSTKVPSYEGTCTTFMNRVDINFSSTVRVRVPSYLSTCGTFSKNRSLPQYNGTGCEGNFSLKTKKLFYLVSAAQNRSLF